MALASGSAGCPSFCAAQGCGFDPTQGACLGCGLVLGQGCVWEAANQLFLSHVDAFFLFLFLSKNQ